MLRNDGESLDVVDVHTR